MEKNGIIRKSESSWVSPVLVVPKKGSSQGKFAPRICIDYRPLNEKTKKKEHPLPKIGKIFEEVNDCKYITTLDLFSGYHQLRMTERAIERSAFRTRDGQWEYTRMPFGLHNAPATFQQMMYGIFGDMVGKNIAIYLDDTTIYTKTYKEHLKVLEEVLKRLREHGLFLKPKKCAFAIEEVKL